MLALSQGSRDLLELLNAWPDRQATPITHIHVSQTDGLACTRLSAKEQHVPALGYVVSAQAVQDSLRREAVRQKICITYESHITALSTPGQFKVQPNGAVPHTITTRLLVFCEGGVPEPDADLRHDYAQHALLCLATPRDPHKNLAYARFTKLGPIALLPSGNDYAVVWSVPRSGKDALLHAEDKVWLDQMNEYLPPDVRLTTLRERADYPLGLRMRRDIVGPRCVWLGNAAQTLHPVAGQGFNLALRDAWTLADILGGEEDPGCQTLLNRYACSRRMDRTATARFTDLLAWGFASQLPGLVPLRDLGLIALGTLPPLRRFLGRRMIFGARAWP